MTPAEARFLAEARAAVLATVDPGGRPRLVPVCFVVGGEDQGAEEGGTLPMPLVWTPIDEKPKRVDDPHRLARILDILERPAVSLLVDRWDEDWDRLAWLRVHGHAEIFEPTAVDAAIERAAVIGGLRAKYPQYVDHDLESRPLVRITPTEITSWGDL